MSDLVAVKNAELASGQAGQARQITEVQTSMLMANRFPRDMAAVEARILANCKRMRFAEHALYSYQRGGSAICGPSIRLAESFVRDFGNMESGFRVISTTGEESEVEAFAWDYQTNCRQSRIFVVPHIRYTKRGAYRLEDPRDIYEAVANQAARRVRACILAIIPADLVDLAVETCDKTLSDGTDMSKDKIDAIVSAFSSMGVSKAQIEKRIQCNLDAIQPHHLLDLRKVYNSIKDGMSGANDWFDVEDVLPVGKVKGEK